MHSFIDPEWNMTEGVVKLKRCCTRGLKTKRPRGLFKIFSIYSRPLPLGNSCSWQNSKDKPRKTSVCLKRNRWKSKQILFQKKRWGFFGWDVHQIPKVSQFRPSAGQKKLFDFWPLGALRIEIHESRRSKEWVVRFLPVARIWRAKNGRKAMRTKNTTY